MGTVTAMVHVGAGHPNDDGLLGRSMAGPIFLQENSRPAWTHHDSRRHSCSLIPSRPETVLEDGLIFIGVRLLEWRVSGPFGSAFNEGGRLNMTALIPDQQSRDEIVAEAKQCSEHQGRKLVISVMHGSSLLTQLPTLEAWPGLEVEVLTPCFVRVSNRWTPNVPLLVGDLESG